MVTRQQPVNLRLPTAIAFSILFAVAFFLFWPTAQINDDGAIALKYMDNFAAGYFYTYNVGDPPVFGLSGFIHGVLAGAIAYLHLLSPLNSLFASNFIGLVLVVFFSLQLLESFVRPRPLAYVSVLVLLTASPSFITSVKMGLETPVHLALILGTLWAWEAYHPSVWLLSALCIISKLDAVPIVIVIGSLALLGTLAPGGPHSIRRVGRQVVCLGLAPLLAWSLFAVWLFGSPMPLAASSKLLLHAHPPHPFEFCRKLIWLWPILGAALSLIILQSLPQRATGWFKQVKNTTFLLAAVGVVGLYVWYNPSERHSWYYAVPEVLILFQLFVSTGAVTRDAPGRREAIGAFILVAVLVVSVCYPRVYSAVRSSVKYLETVERERMRVGYWLRTHSVPNDILLTGHGHIAEQARLYSLDYSGLNSRQAAAVHNDKQILLAKYHPRWFVQIGFTGDQLLVPAGYALAKSFYDISNFEYAKAWRIFEYSPSEPRRGYIPVSADMVLSNGSIEMGQGLKVEASSVEIRCPESVEAILRLRAGIVLGGAAAHPECLIYPADGGPAERREMSVEYWTGGPDGGKHSGEMVVEIGSVRRPKEIVIWRAGAERGPGEPFRLIEPVIEYVPKE